MRTFKRGTAATLLLLSPLLQAEGLEDQLNAFFAQKLAGFSDDVRVTVRTPPNLYPSCEAPSFSVTGSTKLWGNVNVLARCANENGIYRLRYRRRAIMLSPPFRFREAACCNLTA